MLTARVLVAISSAAVGVVAFVVCAILAIVWTTIGVPPGRSRRIRSMASSMGASYRWRAKGAVPFGFGPLRGRDGWWLHELRLERGGRPIIFGDLPATSASVGRAVSFAWVDIGSALPAVSIRPRHMSLRALDRLKNVHVSFESEAFNRRFQVDTTDVAEASRIVDARFIDAVMGLDEDVSVELGSRGLAVFTTGIAGVARIPGLIASLDPLVERLPSSAVRYFSEEGVRGAPLTSGATLDRETLARSPHARRALWALAGVIVFLVIRTLIQALTA